MSYLIFATRCYCVEASGLLHTVNDFHFSFVPYCLLQHHRNWWRIFWVCRVCTVTKLRLRHSTLSSTTCTLFFMHRFWCIVCIRLSLMYHFCCVMICGACELVSKKHASVLSCALVFPFSISISLIISVYVSISTRIKSHSLRNQYVPPKLANGSSSPKTPHSPKKTLVSFFKRSSTAESLPRPASVNSTTNANTANNSVSNNVSTNGATQNIPFGSSNGKTAVVMTDNASFDHRSTLDSSQPAMRNKIDSDNVSVFSGNDVMTGMQTS